MTQAIARTNSLTVTACADPNFEAATKLAASAGHATAHESVDDMLDRADVDMVIVATPHHVLADLSLRAIRAGKHVLAEKPIAINEHEAAQVEEAVAQMGVSYMAGYSFRYVAALQQVKDLLRDGAVGEIQTVMGIIGSGPMLTGWKSRLETGGGPLLFLGSHLVDEVLWFVEDDPIEVFASQRHRSDTGADETSAFQISFARGATAQCVATQAVDSSLNHVDICGREGRISLRSAGFLNYEITVQSKTLAPYAHATTIRPLFSEDRITQMHLPQLEEFAQAVHERRQPSITVRDGRRALKVMDAVVASDQTGQPVQLL